MNKCLYGHCQKSSRLQRVKRVFRQFFSRNDNRTDFSKYKLSFNETKFVDYIKVYKARNEWISTFNKIRFQLFSQDMSLCN